jgi:hypothetical protein
MIGEAVASIVAKRRIARKYPGSRLRNPNQPREKPHDNLISTASNQQAKQDQFARGGELINFIEQEKQ